MGRRKKFEIVEEQVTPMKEDAMNVPVEEVKDEVIEESEVASEVKEEVTEPVEEAPVEEVKEEVVEEVKKFEPVKKRIQSTSSLVNVREKPDGEVLFRVQNGTAIVVEDEVDGWCKITGYVMKELVGEL